MKVAIIGGGLAGTSCASVLNQYGSDCIIYESGKDVASGASGNALGLYNPRFSAERTAQAEYYIRAFELALKVFPSLGDIGWNPCGALHLITDEKKQARFTKMAENWAWSDDEMYLSDIPETQELSGLNSPVNILHSAVFLGWSGMVKPGEMCKAYAANSKAKIETGIRVENLNDIDADIIILANSAGVLNFPQAAHLPIQTIRGQVTHVKATERSQDIKTALCYSGYITPAVDGMHMVGSTFQRWLEHTDILSDDDVDNIAKLEAAVPGLTEGMKVVGHRAAVRSASKDQFPIVGKLRDNLYISAAHGSHGILSSLMAAHILGAMIMGTPCPVPEETLQALSPMRYK